LTPIHHSIILQTKKEKTFHLTSKIHIILDLEGIKDEVPKVPDGKSGAPQILP
jgi:hypothetical protein